MKSWSLEQLAQYEHSVFFSASSHLRCICSVSYARICFKLWKIVPINVPRSADFFINALFHLYKVNLDWLWSPVPQQLCFWGFVTDTFSFSRLKSTIRLLCTGYGTSCFEKTTLLFIERLRKSVIGHKRSAANGPRFEVIHDKFLGCFLAVVISHVPYKLLTDASGTTPFILQKLLLSYKRPLPVTCLLLQITIKTGHSDLSNLKDTFAGYEELEYRDRHISRHPWTQHNTQPFNRMRFRWNLSQYPGHCTGDSKSQHCELLIWAQANMVKLHLGTPLLPQPISSSLPDSSSVAAPNSPHTTNSRVNVEEWAQVSPHLPTWSRPKSFLSLLFFSFHPSFKALVSGTDTGHSRRLNQEGENLTALAVLSSFLFSPSSIGTVLNYTKIACKALINLTCSNAAFPR